MRRLKRAFLKIVSILWCTEIVLLLIGVPLLSAKTSDTYTNTKLSKSITTHYGSVTINLSNYSDSLYVILKKNFNSALHIRNKGTIRLPVGKYSITIVAKYVQNITIPVKIKRGQHINIKIPLSVKLSRKEYLKNSSYPVLHKGINVEILTDVDSRVIINGSTYGYGITRLMLKKGKYQIITRQPEVGCSIREVIIKANPPHFHELIMYNSPSVWTVRTAAFIPGGAQFLKKDMTKAKVLFASITIGIIAGLHYNNLFKKRKSAYETSLYKYINSTTESEALRLGNLTEELNNKAKKTQRVRNIVVGSVAALYLYNVLDAWLNTPKGGYRNTDNSKAHLQAYLTPNKSGLQVTIPF